MLFACVAVAWQEPAPEVTEKETAPTFQSRVNLVLVPVVVRDGQGRAIGDLTKDDFQLFDKGKPQTIASFSVMKRGSVLPATPPAEAATGAVAPSAQSPSPPAPERYVAYLFDDLNIDFGDLVGVKKAAARHMANGLQASDRAAIYTTSGQTTLDFTDNKTKLQETIAQLKVRSMFQHVGRQCPDLSYYMADLIVNKNDPMALQAATLETLACMGLDPTQQSTAQQIAQSAPGRNCRGRTGHARHAQRDQECHPANGCDAGTAAHGAGFAGISGPVERSDQR